LFADPIEGRAESLLIDTECVDLKVGGARISDRYPNRIITSKTARAADVLELTRLARDRVMERRDISLETAICFVDEDGRAVDL
jgi:UDP-N-acetylenolpyruvoylglucosamine reductase